MKQALLILLVLLCPSWAIAETVEGRLDEVRLNGETITVDGVVYEAVTESTKVYYGGSVVGEEALTKGDKVRLVFSDEENANGKRVLQLIILVQASKGGLES